MIKIYFRILVKIKLHIRVINIATVDGVMDEMIKKANGKRTIPQIFFENKNIGGYDEKRGLEK